MIVSATAAGKTFAEGCEQGNMDVKMNLSEVNGAFPSIPTGTGGFGGLQMRVSCYSALMLDEDVTRGIRYFEGKGTVEVKDGTQFAFRDANATISFTAQTLDGLGLPDDGQGGDLTQRWYIQDVDGQGTEQGRPYVLSGDAGVSGVFPFGGPYASKIGVVLTLSTLFGVAGRRELRAASGLTG